MDDEWVRAHRPWSPPVWLSIGLLVVCLGLLAMCGYGICLALNFPGGL